MRYEVFVYYILKIKNPYEKQKKSLYKIEFLKIIPGDKYRCIQSRLLFVSKILVPVFAEIQHDITIRI